eukprot:1360241-Pleurochrysis_carterae.AAC.1
MPRRSRMDRHGPTQTQRAQGYERQNHRTTPLPDRQEGLGDGEVAACCPPISGSMQECDGVLA